MQGIKTIPSCSLQHARQFSSSCKVSSASTSYSTAQIAPLPRRSVLEISGPDAPKFLKGLTCKDVDNLGGGYSGFLNASGRVLHTNFIFPIPSTSSLKPQHPTYLITHDSGSDHPTPLETFLPPFKLRSKVRIKDVTSAWSAWAAWGGEIEEGLTPTRTWKLGSGGAAESQWSWDDGVRDLGLGQGEVGCWDPRAGVGEGALGRQILVPKGQEPKLLTSHKKVTSGDYDTRRMILGLPEGPDEIIPGSALPLESCMDVHGGVDFRKGCYLGQELTVRTYHTGATRKRLLPLRIIPLDEPSLTIPLASFIPLSTGSTSYPKPQSGLTIPVDQLIGSEITFYPGEESSSKKPRSAGKILSLRPLPSEVGIVGIGLVRTEMASKTWWSPSVSPSELETQTVGHWWTGTRSRLGIKIGDVNYGVWVGEGEAFAAARKEMRRVEKERAALIVGAREDLSVE